MELENPSGERVSGLLGADIDYGQWPWLQMAIESYKPDEYRPPPFFRRVLNKLGFTKPLAQAPDSGYPNAIYILIYHSVVDPQNRNLWEECYQKGEVTAEQFRVQIEFMLSIMTPIPLSAAPDILEHGPADRPYFAITFDDGFRNNLTVADPIVQEFALKPTVFVNSAFARGQEVFFRVLSAIIIAKGHEVALATRLQQLAPQHIWSEDGETLFGQMKQHYVANVMEQATGEIYQQFFGDPAELGVHLGVAETIKLQLSGWEIANHTTAHRLLSSLSSAEARTAIEDNARFWQESGVELIDFLGFPVGRVCDVSPAVGQWLDENPKIHGIFANNGINVNLQRKEWLRFSLGQHDKPESMQKILINQVVRTKSAYKQLIK